MQDADGPVAFGLDSLQLVVREYDILAFGILVALDDLVGLHLRAGVLTHLLLTDAHAVPSELVEADTLFLNGGVEGHRNMHHSKADGRFSRCCGHKKHLISELACPK